MTIRSGLVYLAEQVGAVFLSHEAEWGPVVVDVGFRKRAQQVNQASGRAQRIIFTPGDERGAAGRLVQPRSPGNELAAGRGRHLFTWERAVLVSVWAADTTGTTDEKKQIEAVETLFERLCIAVQTVAHQDAIWGDLRWTLPAERSFGVELLAMMQLRGPIFDLPLERIVPTLGTLTKNQDPP